MMNVPGEIRWKQRRKGNHLLLMDEDTQPLPTIVASVDKSADGHWVARYGMGRFETFGTRLEAVREMSERASRERQVNVRHGSKIVATGLKDA